MPRRIQEHWQQWQPVTDYCETGQRNDPRGVRSGSEFRESIRDGRIIYVDGQRVDDVTTYRPFEGIIEILASLYDVQKERPDEPGHLRVLAGGGCACTSASPCGRFSVTIAFCAGSLP